MATRITLSGGTQYEVEETYEAVSAVVREGWTGSAVFTTTAGATVLINVPMITSVQATTATAA